MPDGARPLLTDDIQRLLQGIFTDPAAPVELALEAFTVTAASLYSFCSAADIDAAIGRVRPSIPGYALACV
jgi:hypothetical protein